MGNPISVTLSSVGVSRGINLDWFGGEAVSASLTFGSSTATTDVTFQYTLDDLQRSSNPTWLGVSSAIGSSVQHFFSSVAFDQGVLLTFVAPIAGLRLSSTT